MERTQLFTYDSLNRLATAETLHQNQPWWQGDSPTAECWGEQFNYDPWGNLTGISPVSSAYTGCTQENWSMTPTTKNQLQDTNGDYVYDAAGNLIQPGPIGGLYVFDAENHLTSAGGMAYLYDGDGKRVGKAPASTPTQPNYLYWYGTGSQILEETDGAGNYMYEDYYFNGMLLARGEPDNWVDHFFADALGNTRCVYGDGDPDGGCSDYYPFGGERPIPSCCPTNPGGVNVPFMFTGKERDSESGLDNFGKRYDASSLGRFMTPDAFYKDSHVGDPQSWNEYAYARNNPLRYVDPTGENATVTSNCSTDANNHTTCNVNISASIAIYAAPGSGLTQEQLSGGATTIQNTIQNAWSGTVQQDGVTYNVSTQVSVQVTGSEAEASKTGAQNVVGLSNGPADAAHNANALTGPGNSLGTILRGQDTGTWNYNTLGADTRNTAAHEFAHLLGIDDHSGSVLSNTDPSGRPIHATSSDLGWGIQEATRSVGLGLSMKSWYNGSGGPLPTPFHFSSTDTVGAPFFGWWK